VKGQTKFGGGIPLSALPQSMNEEKKEGVAHAQRGRTAKNG